MPKSKNKKTTVTLHNTSSRRGSKSKSKAKQPHFLAPKILHHRHSFKLVHHAHTSYSLLMFLLLMTGVFSMGWTSFVDGAGYSVNAVIPAKPLTEPATITTPLNNSTTNTQTVTVRGNCPEASYEKLNINGSLGGVALCQSNGTWSVTATLAAGKNVLTAQSYNFTDAAGPISEPMTIFYEPPTSATNSSGSVKGSPAASSAGALSAPLIMTTDYSFVGYHVNQLSNWPLLIDGGSPPYAIRVDWGDDSSDLKSLAASGRFDLQHTYSTAGGYRNSYTIIVTATDQNGQVSILQLLTIISPPANEDSLVGALADGEGSTGLPLLGGASSLYDKFWKAAAPTYGVAMVGVASFWLGQHRELELVRQRAVRMHRGRVR